MILYVIHIENRNSENDIDTRMLQCNFLHNAIVGYNMYLFLFVFCSNCLVVFIFFERIRHSAKYRRRCILTFYGKYCTRFISSIRVVVFSLESAFISRLLSTRLLPPRYKNHSINSYSHNKSSFLLSRTMKKYIFSIFLLQTF